MLYHEQPLLVKAALLANDFKVSTQQYKGMWILQVPEVALSGNNYSRQHRDLSSSFDNFRNFETIIDP